VIVVAAFGLSVLGSVVGLLVASLLLLAGEKVRTGVLPSLVSYAVGTLLGAALLALLPEALESRPAPTVLASLLVGVFTFFILEKLVLWRHSHETADTHLHKSTAALVMVGDAFHTFVDGAVIAAAVTVSLPLGATTAIAVAAHEIPQEVGDVAILLGAGYSRGRAFTLNLLAALSSILGAALMLLFANSVPGLLPYVLGFAAGNFLYVAMADLIPSLHRGGMEDSGVKQVLLIAAGVGTIVIL
jgi:zinc and cadmium transporter